MHLGTGRGGKHVIADEKTTRNVGIKAKLFDLSVDSSAGTAVLATRRRRERLVVQKVCLSLVFHSCNCFCGLDVFPSLIYVCTCCFKFLYSSVIYPLPNVDQSSKFTKLTPKQDFIYLVISHNFGKRGRGYFPD